MPVIVYAPEKPDDPPVIVVPPDPAPAPEPGGDDPDPTPDPDPIVVPQTGDISAMWYAIALLSACGLVVLLRKKRCD